LTPLARHSLVVQAAAALLCTCEPSWYAAGTPAGAPEEDACDCDPALACVADDCVPLAQHPRLSTGLGAAYLVRDDGSLWSWGRNEVGELGQGDTVERLLPSPIAGIAGSSWAAVSTAAGPSVCALDTGAKLFCWGGNASGALGLGDLDGRPAPAARDGAWRAVAMDSEHACAIAEDGGLWCWGRNIDGELATGDTTLRTSPTAVALPEGQSTAVVATGWGHTCAITRQGELHCWGRNVEGQLGLGDRSTRTSPARIGTDRGWRALSLAGQRSCAQRADGSLWCWGRNGTGQLGVGDFVDHDRPTRVDIAGRVTQFSAGVYRTCAIVEGGALLCWGDSGVGDPEGADAEDHEVPSPLGAPDGWEQVACGFRSCCGTRAGGALLCWGDNSFGQLGTGDTEMRADPQEVTF